MSSPRPSDREPGGPLTHETGRRTRATYAAAGVDLDAADAAVDAIGPHLDRTQRREVLPTAAGFAALLEVDTARYRNPVIATATDGVGTKLEIARALGRHDTVGIDLVAMVVDDLVCTGAEPLVFLDYLAVERIEPAAVAEIVAGIADGCVQAGCALVGGETAAHPGVLSGGRYDLAGFGVGIVEREAVLDADRVRPGAAILALPSSGLHANGYSLARRIVADAGLDLQAVPPGFATTLGDALLTPTRIHAPDCLALLEAGGVQGLCHVTGGGIPGNLDRCLPAGLGATIDTATLPVPAVCALLQEAGRVAEAEMWRVFNMGAGMLALVDDAASASALLADRGVDAVVCGRVGPGEGVTLAGLTG